ncbi:MAG TPA: FmdB family zinc ribbon protein [Desulfomonilaceae bacterium]|nr:FmdB family zinc ribbon protein [Desulfomonilaceae bacterium]
MPILDYKCNTCGNAFPKLVLTPENAPLQCPVCKGSDIAYIGPAFDVDERTMIRRTSISCEACGESMCGIADSS